MKKFSSNKAEAITQILILIVGIMAIGYAFGSGVGTVSAQSTCADLGGKCINFAFCGADGRIEGAEDCGVGEWCCDPEEIVLPDQQDSESQESPPVASPAEEYDASAYAAALAEHYGSVDAAAEEAEKAEAGDATAQANIDGILAPLGATAGAISNYKLIKETLTGAGKKAAGKVGEEAGKELAQEWLKNGLFNLKEGASTFANVAYTAAHAAVGAFIVWGFYKWVVNADVRNMRDITVAAGVGFATAVTIGLAAGPGGWAVLGIAAAATLFISLFTFKTYSQETFTYIATAWKAQEGGDNCDACNNLRYGCSEYQCRSFGQGCEIENAGTENEICVWKNPDDIFAPQINASEKVLISADYSYQPLQVTQGVKVHYAKDPSGNGCIPPYTALDLGVETNEFAECKIDTTRTPDFENMAAPMAKIEGFVRDHVLSLPHIATPSVESQKAIGILDADITNGQDQEFYIRCKDPNGNSNVEEFIMEFCVQDSPDTAAPIILGTNLLKFLKHDQTDAHLEVYTNEPADCKWSPEDLDYDQMQFDLDRCSQTEGDYLFAGFRYGCEGNLTGLKDRVENDVYIKCKDKPWWTEGDPGRRYANEDSFKLTLVGTEPLLIKEITVNGEESGATIKDSTTTVKARLEVTASAGAESGKARCAYESAGNFIDFFNEGSTEFLNVNTQNLYLAEGDYNISIRCEDAGGNLDERSIEFSIDTDRETPVVVRTFRDDTQLKIITDEEAECVYTADRQIGCDYVFSDGEEMSSIGQLTHFTAWDPEKEFYIKCKDIFENIPLPGQCSAIVKPFEV